MKNKADLPEDVEMDILFRLPVKSLLRFRCVCKPWCTTFQSPDFITNHYLKQKSLRSTNNNTNTSVLVHSCDYDLRPNQESPYFSVLDETLTIKENIHLPFPKNHFVCCPIIMGPCNGLICLWDSWDEIVLWNPATREFKQLPVSDVERPPCAKPPHFFTIGFGFDSITDDYKVILIVYNFYGDSGSYALQVDLYTLSTNSWREISGVGYQHCSVQKFDTFINGVYHWQRSQGIVAFDMADEVFSTLELPYNFSCDYIWELSSLNESLATFNYPKESHGNCFDVWVMKEYGVKESWIKQLTIGPLFGLAKPLEFWNNGGLFLEFDIEELNRCDELVLYNPNTQDIEKLQIRAIEPTLKVVIYVESLVLINGRREYEDELFIRLPT